MRSTKIPTRPDEDRPRPPLRSGSGRLVLLVLGIGLLAAFVGLIVGTVAEVFLAPGVSLSLGGAVAGLAAGLGLGWWQVRADFGSVTRSARRGSNARLKEGIRTLKDAMASAPPKRVARIAAHRGRVTGVAVTPDGRTLLSGGDDEAVRLWDLRSGFELRGLGLLGGPVSAVAVSPDGRLAAACGADHSMSGPKPTGVAVVWSIESGHELRRFEADGVLASLAFSPDGGRLLSGGADFLRIWDLESAELAGLIPVQTGPVGGEMVLSLAVSPDGRFALCGCRGSEDARLIDLESGECVRRFTGHRAWLRLFRPAAVTSVAFSPDGKRVLTGSHDNTARVWDVDTGKQLSRFNGHAGGWGWGGVVAVRFSPGGRRGYSASEDGTVRVWGIDKAAQKFRFDHGARVCSLALTRDGRVALSGGKDGVVRVWEVPA